MFFLKHGVYTDRHKQIYAAKTITTPTPLRGW